MNTIFDVTAGLGGSSPGRSAETARADHLLSFDSALRLSSVSANSFPPSGSSLFDLSRDRLQPVERPPRDTGDLNREGSDGYAYAAAPAPPPGPPPAERSPSDGLDRQDHSTSRDPAEASAEETRSWPDADSDEVPNGTDPRSNPDAVESDPAAEGTAGAGEESDGDAVELTIRRESEEALIAQTESSAALGQLANDADELTAESGNSENSSITADEESGPRSNARLSAERSEEGREIRTPFGADPSGHDESHADGREQVPASGDPRNASAEAVNGSVADAAAAEETLVTPPRTARSRRQDASGETNSRPEAKQDILDAQPASLEQSAEEASILPLRSTRSGNAAASDLAPLNSTGDESPLKPSDAGPRVETTSLPANHGGRPDSSQRADAGPRAEPNQPDGRGALGPGDAQRFVGRVSRALELAQQRGESLQIRLSPPELGSLRVEIAVRGGVLTAHLEADTNAARAALLENLPALRDRLAEQEIRVDRFEVDVREDSEGHGRERSPTFDDQRRPTAAWGRERRGGVVPETDAEPGPSKADPTRIGNGQLNLVV